MLGLVKKDLFLIVKNLSVVYLFSALIVILPVSRNPALALPIGGLFVSIFLAAQVSVTMGLDENANWKRNVTAMPISTQEEVASKYIVSVMFAVSSLILVLMIGAIASALAPVSRDAHALYAAASFSVGVLYNSIDIPAAYKLGASRSRFVLFAFVGIPAVGAFFLDALGIHISLESILLNTSQLIAIVLGVAFVAMIASFFISVSIQKQRA